MERVFRSNLIGKAGDNLEILYGQRLPKIFRGTYPELAKISEESRKLLLFVYLNLNPYSDHFCLTLLSSQMLIELVDQNMIMFGALGPDDNVHYDLHDLVLDIGISVQGKCHVVKTIRENTTLEAVMESIVDVVERYDELYSGILADISFKLEASSSSSVSADFVPSRAGDGYTEPVIQSPQFSPFSETPRRAPLSNQDLLQMQDAEYYESLRIDEENEKKRRAQEEEERRLKQEQERLELERKQRKEQLGAEVGEEPPESSESVTIRLTFPDSSFKDRRFLRSNPQKHVFMYAEHIYPGELGDFSVVGFDKGTVLKNTEDLISEASLPSRVRMRIQVLQ